MMSGLTIAILEDSLVKVETALWAIERVFGSEAEIYRYELLKHLKMADQKFDLLISDLNLPDSDSSETARFLLTEGWTLARMVLVASTDDETTDFIVARGRGHFESFYKPGSFSKQLSRARDRLLNNQTHLVGLAPSEQVSTTAPQPKKHNETTASILGEWVFDDLLNRVEISLPILRFLGYGRDELNSIEQLLNLSHPSDHVRLEYAIAGLNRGAFRNFSCSFRIQTKAGKWVWLTSKGVSNSQGIGRSQKSFSLTCWKFLDAEREGPVRFDPNQTSSQVIL